MFIELHLALMIQQQVHITVQVLSCNAFINSL